MFVNEKINHFLFLSIDNNTKSYEKYSPCWLYLVLKIILYLTWKDPKCFYCFLNQYFWICCHDDGSISIWNPDHDLFATFHFPSPCRGCPVLPQHPFALANLLKTYSTTHSCGTFCFPSLLRFHRTHDVCLSSKSHLPRWMRVSESGYQEHLALTAVSLVKAASQGSQITMNTSLMFG